jgi:hypothetical protein
VFVSSEQSFCVIDLLIPCASALGLRESLGCDSLYSIIIMHSAEQQTQTHNPLKRRSYSDLNDSSPDMGVNPPDDPSLQESPSYPNPKDYKPRRSLYFFSSFLFFF